MNKKIQVSILSIFIAAALIGSVATVGNNMAFAGGNHDDNDDNKDKKSNHNGKKSSNNDAVQGIGQSTETLQSSSCGSGNDTKASCNNLAFSVNVNDGNNALGQE
jgi:hypothetical protein